MPKRLFGPRPSEYTRVQLIAVMLVGVVSLVGSLAAVGAVLDALDHDGRAQAEVLTAERHGVGKRRYCELDVRFTAEAERHEYSGRRSGDCPAIGSRVPVFYDPDVPTDLDWENPWVGVVVVTGIFTLLLAWSGSSVVRALLSRRRSPLPS